MDKFKRGVGFIKSHSHKKFGRHSSSSDSFSSFQYDPQPTSQHFSPYRHPIQQIAFTKQIPMIKERQLEHKLLKKTQIHAVKPKFTNQMLKQNLMQKVSSKWIQPTQAQKKLIYEQDVKRDANVHQQESQVNRDYQQKQYEQNSEQETPKLLEEAAHQNMRQDLSLNEELSLTNINNFPSTKQNIEPSVSLLVRKQHQTANKYKRYMQEEYLPSQHQQNKQKFKLLRDQNKKRQKKYFEQQQLIAQWDKQQFKDKSIKQTIINYNKGRHTQPQNHKIYQTPGGICFQLDKYQFKIGQSNAGFTMNKGRAKKKANCREEIIRRRLSAKLYDRLARAKIFGCN